MPPAVTPAGATRVGPRHRALALLLAAALLPPAALASGAGDAATGPTSAERQRFVAAERALARGQRPRFRRLAESLRDYPLYPYLLYAALRRDLERASATRVRAFWERYPDSPLADRLRERWIESRARRADWHAVLDAYHEGLGVAARCRWLEARHETGDRDEALALAIRVWLSPRSRPRACDPLFARLREARAIGPGPAWQRFALAMEAGERRLARYLERYLDPGARGLAASWRRALRRPAAIPALARRARLAGARGERALRHALGRLARRDPDRADRLWRLVRDESPPPAAARAAIDRDLAVAAARDHRPDAARRIAALPGGELDAVAAGWGVMSAVRAGAWPLAARLLRRLPGDSEADPRWRYWRARIALENGADASARRSLVALAGERGYYGFLAADRLGLPYRMGHRDLDPDARALEALAARAPARRARELLRLGRRADARREWSALLRGLDRRARAVAASLAGQWSWHSQAIFSAARSSHRDDLELRFPLAHRAEVLAAARTERLSPDWVFAVARQESAFMADARSPAGALGLMQLMPATGRTVARWLRRPPPTRRQLLEPATSLRLGSVYLRHLLDRYGGNAVLATAAYNAGPRRVDGWLPRHDALPADVWIDTVPFGETRAYVRRVLSYAVVYASRLGHEASRMADRLAPVAPRARRAAAPGGGAEKAG